MGIGPAPAIKSLLLKSSLKLNVRTLFYRLLSCSCIAMQDIDLVEVNEAFAPQCLAVAKEVGIDPAKFAMIFNFTMSAHMRTRLNVSGGAIALGHPLGMSGARILTHLTHEAIRRKTKYSIGSACIGGGQVCHLCIHVCSTHPLARALPSCSRTFTTRQLPHSFGT